MTIIDDFKALAKKNPKKIVLPESSDERLLQAAQLATEEGIAKILLLGKPDEVKKKAAELKVDLSGVEIIDPASFKKLDSYVKEYCRMRGKSEAIARALLSKPIYFGAMMVKMGDADGIVMGAVYTSGEVIAGSHLILGLQEGVETPSSFFLMDIPDYGQLLFADASVNIQPTAEQLADTAIASATTAKVLLDWDPRVAMLSFSTKGSANHPDADKVINATDIVKKKRPDIKIDGELQGDSALVPDIAQKKIKGEVGPVAGRANVLIFPDLDAGNIAYKLVQTLAKATCYGPVLQGFSRPVSDLSRGAKVRDILGTIAMLGVWAGRVKR